MPAPEAIETAARLARDRAGLRVTEHVRSVLERFLDRRCRELGISEDVYLSRLHVSSPDSGELEHVIREITIGETHFFRGPIMDAVRRLVLPEVVRRRGQEPLPQLRMASAGCATGEEPYSLAIAARETLPEDGSWTVAVTGVDVNTAFLKRAREAHYSDWSLRDLPEVDRRRWFEREGQRFRLDPDLRSMVRFHYVNLAVDPLPAAPLGLVGLDLVICQNVLMYFEREIRAEVAAKLVRCLAPEGFLIFGPADLIPLELPPCRTRTFGNVVAFQKPSRGAPRPFSWRPPSMRLRASERPLASIDVAAAVPPPPPGIPQEALDQVVFHRQSSPSPAPSSTAASAAPTWDEALELADCGDLEAAALAFEAIVLQDPAVARAHLYQGLLLVELDAPEAALEAFRRALYLDSALLLGHAAMALVARRLGLDVVARRHARRVHALTKQRAESAAVEGWKGMTAGRLLRLFEQEVEVLTPERDDG